MSNLRYLEIRSHKLAFFLVFSILSSGMIGEIEYSIFLTYTLLSSYIIMLELLI